jgi:hypothetical protein
MKKFLKILAVLVGLAVIFVIAVSLLTPWMDRWGATETEIQAAFAGDELVPAPAWFVNRAVTIQANPEQIYPWLVQLGADKGGMYSYTALETMIACPQVNADRIHEEWQALQVGDPMRMCPEGSGPPPYEVALLVPNQAVVLGHKENNQWVDLWQLVIVPQPDGSSRLIQRTRTMMVGGLWDIIHPGVFIMERGMLLGIKDRAEKLAQGE